MTGAVSGLFRAAKNQNCNREEDQTMLHVSLLHQWLTKRFWSTAGDR